MTSAPGTKLGRDEIGETDGTNFIATEYIEGKILNDRESLSLIAALMPLRIILVSLFLALIGAEASRLSELI